MGRFSDALDRRIDDLPRGLLTSLICSALLLFVWSAIGGNGDFVAAILSMAAMFLIAVFWLVIWLAAEWEWRTDRANAPARYAVTVLTFPLGIAIVIGLAMPARDVVHYFKASKYEALLTDSDFKEVLATGGNSFSFGRVKVEVDRTAGRTRLAFDRDGYVVRSSAYVFDPTGEVGSQQDERSKEYFGYRVSPCRNVRKDFYWCSFS